MDDNVDRSNARRCMLVSYAPRLDRLRRLWRETHSLLSLAIPIIAALATASLMGVVDSAVVGALGQVELAAVSLTSSVVLVFVAALYGLLSPIGILAARAFGAANPSGVSAQWRNVSMTLRHPGTLI